MHISYMYANIVQYIVQVIFHNCQHWHWNEFNPAIERAHYLLYHFLGSDFIFYGSDLV